MKVVASNKYRVVRPEDPEYRELSEQFRVDGPHLAVNVRNPADIVVLPVKYRVVREGSKPIDVEV